MEQGKGRAAFWERTTLSIEKGNHPLPNQNTSSQKVFKSSAKTWLKPRPESGLDCLTCAKFARPRATPRMLGLRVGVEGWGLGVETSGLRVEGCGVRVES